VLGRRVRATSIADATRAYIDEHPSIREALREDLVNFTLLARKIQVDRELPNEEAITIACRRYQRSLLAPSLAEASILPIVRASRLEIHGRVGLIRFRNDFEVLDHLLALGRKILGNATHPPVFEVFEGSRAVTVLCEEPLLAPLLEAIPPPSLLGVERSLASLAFRSRPEVAETAGVLAFMAEALFRAGVNVLETVSVHSDSIFVFRDTDVIRAYQTLTQLWGEPGSARPRTLRSQQPPARALPSATPP
jgi:hypothetical protein